MLCYEVLRLQNLTIFEVEFYSYRQLGAAGASPTKWLPGTVENRNLVLKVTLFIGG